MNSNFQTDIMDVNTIFKDLSEMVQEGGEKIGNFVYIQYISTKFELINILY